MSTPAFDPMILPAEVKDLINQAFESGSPMLLAAVNAQGQPVLSYRGSAQTYSDDQIGLWIRKAQGDTIEALRQNPNVALVYRSATTPVLQFHGRARIATDPAETAKVFESAPAREQASDPERKGVAIIIDLDRVEGVLRRGPDGPVFCRLARAAS